MAGISPKLPLSRSDTDGITLNKSVFSAAQQNLKMLILTSPGERIMMPDFGVGLRRYLFRNVHQSTFNEIRQGIEQQVRKYLPYIRIIQVEFVREKYDESTQVLEGTTPSNYVSMMVYYTFNNSQQQLSIDL
jgi:phage baseplate assembly protein W